MEGADQGLSPSLLFMGLPELNADNRASPRSASSGTFSSPVGEMAEGGLRGSPSFFLLHLFLPMAHIAFAQIPAMTPAMMPTVRPKRE